MIKANKVDQSTVWTQLQCLTLFEDRMITLNKGRYFQCMKKVSAFFNSVQLTFAQYASE